jgi:predicted RNase H-like HicB family nuclease
MFHMLMTIAIQRLRSGDVLATAPDLPGCSVLDRDESDAFARIRLAVEGALADLLLAGRPVPDVRPGAEWRADPGYRDARWYDVHINMRHLEALARHQAGRPAAGSGGRIKANS